MQVYRDPGFTIVQHGKELHSWQVLLNGVLEIKEEGLPPKLLHVGESFGMPAATQVTFHNMRILGKKFGSTNQLFYSIFNLILTDS